MLVRGISTTRTGSVSIEGREGEIYGIERGEVAVKGKECVYLVMNMISPRATKEV